MKPVTPTKSVVDASTGARVLDRAGEVAPLDRAEREQVAAGVAGWDDCALTIYSTVVSRAGPDRGILDAGSKTLTSDTGGGLDGHGLSVVERVPIEMAPTHKNLAYLRDKREREGHMLDSVALHAEKKAT